jgi:serine/threonine protein kinase
MSDHSHESSRPRTVSRLRYVAPPGMQVDSGEGRKTIGRYEILKTIGRGAMGVVYKARDPLLDRVVAVKTIVSPQGAGRRTRSAYLERFQREAKAAAKMSHPAIVTIFDVGVDEEWGAPFMVLEYLPGESLADRLDRVRMPLGKGIMIALDLASSLAFAHRQRIVHRDVKPANVLHAGENRWKLADFGIARLPDSDLTQVGIFMGTPGYSPPESIREGRYTPQADVFAWGAVLYELLSGRIPYEGPDTKTTNSYVVKGDAVPPTAHDVSIPEPLSRVVMHALESQAQNRLKDGADAEQALREAWERCLTQGLVAPAALAGEEVPHDKVGSTMHGRVTNPQAWADQSTSGARDGGRRDADPTRRDPGRDRGGRSPAVIESDRAGDDDPTRILIRDDLKPRVREDSEPAAPPPPGSGARQVSSSGARKDIGYDATMPHRPGQGPAGEGSGTDRVAKVARSDARKKAAPTQASNRRSVPAWIVVLLVAAIVGALAGTYLVLASGS